MEVDDNYLIKPIEPIYKSKLDLKMENKNQNQNKQSKKENEKKKLNLTNEAEFGIIISDLERRNENGICVQISYISKQRAKRNNCENIWFL